MATAAIEHVGISPLMRRAHLHQLATAARSLALCAEQGQDYHQLAAQLALTVRRFARVLEFRPNCEEVSREIDALGQQIQFAGRGLLP